MQISPPIQDGFEPFQTAGMVSPNPKGEFAKLLENPARDPQPLSDREDGGGAESLVPASGAVNPAPDRPDLRLREVSGEASVERPGKRRDPHGAKARPPGGEGKGGPGKPAVKEPIVIQDAAPREPKADIPETALLALPPEGAVSAPEPALAQAGQGGAETPEFPAAEARAARSRGLETADRETPVLKTPGLKGEAAPALEGARGASAGPASREEAGEAPRRGTAKEALAQGRPRLTEGPNPAFHQGLESGGREQPGLPGPAGALERENGKNSKAETSKDRDKRRERIALAVRDYRAGGAGTAQNAPLPLVETGPAAAREPELPADFRAPGGKPLGGGGDREAKPALGLRDPPALEFAENLNGDIVRHASVILRSGGSGTIRLALKPETLGNIKIRLEMTENKVMGHIILETKEALRAFERELQGLEQAFRDSGFDGADFEMALTSGGGENSGDAPGNGENFPFVAGRLAASTYDAALESAEEFPFWDIPAGEGRVFVNVLV